MISSDDVSIFVSVVCAQPAGDCSLHLGSARVPAVAHLQEQEGEGSAHPGPRRQGQQAAPPHPQDPGGGQEGREAGQRLGPQDRHHPRLVLATHHPSQVEWHSGNIREALYRSLTFYSASCAGGSIT